MAPAFAVAVPARGTVAAARRAGACARPEAAAARRARARSAKMPVVASSAPGAARAATAGSTASPAPTLICTSLTAATVDGQLEEMRAAKEAGADLAEIRVDLLEVSEQAAWKTLVERKVLPVIVTNRASWEGGNAPVGEPARLQVLLDAARAGAEYVDVELAAHGDFLSLQGDSTVTAKVILSHHNFLRSMTLSEIEFVYKSMVKAGADVCKIAMMATSACDNARVFFSVARLTEKPFVLLAMGELGQCSRILAPKYGAFLTFASVGAGRESAPGQVTASSLLDMYRFRSIGPETEVYGVIGNPVSHSMSPALHNAAFADAGIDAVYVPLKVDDDVDVFVRTMVLQGFVGFSVTIPGKVQALGAMDFVEKITSKIGAMNTVVTKENGELWGYNTDWVAAISAIEEGLVASRRSLANARVLCIGAGGAARGLAFGALSRGAGQVVIANRTYEKAQVLAQEIGKGASALALESVEPGATGQFDVVMNTTSVGMVPNVTASPLPGGPEALKALGTPLVFDAVYNPLETRLLSDAGSVGCTCVSGLEMFVRQAAEQFKLWFPDSEPNVPLMRSVVLSKLGGS